MPPPTVPFWHVDCFELKAISDPAVSRKAFTSLLTAYRSLAISLPDARDNYFFLILERLICMALQTVIQQTFTAQDGLLV